MLPKLIAITGKKFNGKDTIGDYLVKNYGYIKLGFADALKDACGAIFGFNNDQLYGNKKEEIDDFWKISPRSVLQFVGTELFRENISKIIPHVEKDIWIVVMEKKIQDILKKEPNAKIVITDVRFNNESNFVRKFGGVQIRVNRTSNKNNTYSMHDSEIFIDKINVNYDIYNDASLEDLYFSVDILMNNLSCTIINSFDQIYTNFEGKNLLVFDIDDTIFTMSELNKQWWINKYEEYAFSSTNMQEINSKILLDWEKIIESQYVEHKDKDNLLKLLNNKSNSVICLTSRNKKFKDITFKQLSKIGINLPVYYCNENNKNKGDALQEILETTYSDYNNIIFVDDLIENIISVNDKLKNKLISQSKTITCYWIL